MRPPPWAERLLSWFYRGPGGGEIAGDLAEELDAVAHARGRRAARRWYRRQVLRSIGAKLLAKARPGPLDTRRERLMSGFLSETRLGLRSLIRRPGFAMAALATLALGLGASTAMFAVVDAVLLRPLPYAHASRLITLRQLDRETSAGPDRISPATFLDWRDTARAYDDVAVVRPWTFTFTGGSQPEEIDAGLVSAGFFDLIGVRAAIGRTFTPADREAGGSVPVVVSDRLWRRLFGADPSVIGTTVPFEDLRLTIVGVLPSTFWWIDRDQLMWAPYSLAESARRLRAQTYLTAVGRLGPATDVEAAAAEADVLWRRLAQTHPETYADSRPVVRSIGDDVAGTVKPALWLLFGGVALVCLIAIANVAGLTLVRSTERHRELQVRAALGAGPIRLARQLLTESLLLSAGGAALGLLLADWLLRLMIGLTPIDVPRLDEATIGGRSALYGLLLALGTGLVVACGPAWRWLRADGLGTLRASAPAGGQTSRWRHALVAGQVALTFVLLAGAALLGRSFVRLLDVDPGFQARNVALFELHIWSAYPQPEAQALFFRDTLDRVRDFPGVLAAGAVSAPPFLGGPSIEIETDVTAPGTSRDARPAWLTFATPGYFDTMQIPVRDGRTFAAEDRAGHPPVAIVSEGLAARLFDGRALGRQIVVGNERTPAPLEVVGVVASLRHVGLDSAPRDEIFVPVAQAPFGSMNVVVRMNGDPSASVAGLADRIRAPAPAVTISGVTLLDDLVNETIRPRRFYLAMASWLAGTALVLAAVGLYGLISFLVTLRTREMGLRMALGGGRGHVLRLVLATAAMPAIAGIVAGGAGALVGAAWLRAGLYGVAPTDPVTFAGAAVALLGVAVAAAVVPARRALRVDPVTALRDE